MARGREGSGSDVSVAQLRAQDVPYAVASTSRAFWPDPLFGYFARDAVQEHAVFPFFARAMVNDSLRYGVVWAAYAGGRCVGSASWLPPGAFPRSAGREARLTGAVVRALLRGRNRASGVRLLRAMEGVHPPEAHWYLGLLGVDPSYQGRGLGRLLLSPILERCDEEGVPAYLETQKPENLAFYSRFGFVVRHEVSVPGTPPVWTMWREPRTG